MGFYLQNAEGRRQEIKNDRCTIGRSRTNDIIAEADRVSRIHAEFSIDGGKLYITDRGSANGTRLNEMKLEPGVRTALKDGDTLTLANVETYTVISENAPNFMGADDDGTMPEGDYTEPADEAKDFSAAYNYNSRKDTDSETAHAASSVQSTDFASMNRMPEAPKKKKPIVLFAVIGIVLAGIIGLLGVNFANHMKAQKLYDSGSYDAAYEAACKDRLFSSKLQTDCLISAGNRALTNGDFEKAESYYKRAGDDGRSRYVDAIYDHADMLIENEQYDKAEDVLAAVSSEPDTECYEARILLHKAYDELLENDISDADKLKARVGRSFAEDSAWYANAESAWYLLHGINDSSYFSMADKNAFNDEFAELHTALYNALSQRDLVGAAKAMEALTGSNTYYYTSLVDWIDDLRDAALYDGDINAVLRLNAYLLGYDSETLTSDRIAKKLSSYGQMTSINSCSSKWLKLGSTDESRIGAAPNGKILIIAEYHPFDAERRKYIAFDLMQYLPEGYYPESLEEVQYVIEVRYDYTVGATYGSEHIKGLRENCYINTFTVPGWRSTFVGTRVYGPSMPDYIYAGAVPYYSTGAVKDTERVAEDLVSQIVKLTG